MREDDPLLSVPDAAAFLGIAVSTLYRWIDRGALESTTSPGGRVRVSRSALIALAPRMNQMRRNVRRAQGE